LHNIQEIFKIWDNYELGLKFALLELWNYNKKNSNFCVFRLDVGVLSHLCG
jgi:hypothetical protein